MCIVKGIFQYREFNSVSSETTLLISRKACLISFVHSICLPFFTREASVMGARTWERCFHMDQ